MEIIRHVKNVLIQTAGENFFLLFWWYESIETLKNQGKEIYPRQLSLALVLVIERWEK